MSLNPLAPDGRVRARLADRSWPSPSSPPTTWPFPDFVNHAERWITHLGNVAAPLTGVVLAHYLIRERRRIDVDALFDPDGRYRYRNGINVEAILAVIAGVAIYYALPHAWLKVAWGLGAGAAIYLALVAVAHITSSRSSYRAVGRDPEVTFRRKDR